MLDRKHVTEGLNKLKQFHSDEDGAEMAEIILIVALISLPIIAALITAREDMMEWFDQKWDEILDLEDDSGGSDDSEKNN